jgi:hypothetical protein
VGREYRAKGITTVRFDGNPSSGFPPSFINQYYFPRQGCNRWWLSITVWYEAFRDIASFS